VECGLWPLKEAISGEVVHTYIPKLQAVAHIQKGVDVYWAQVNKAERMP